jgi:hypothetical protein
MVDEPDDLGVDPNVFYSPGPLWVVAVRKTVGLDEKTGEPVANSATAIVSGSTKNRRFIAVFTDEDLAERFVAQQGSLDFIPAKILSAAEYVGLLETWPRTGFTHVAYDLGKARTPARFMVPIARAADEIKRQYGLGRD